MKKVIFLIALMFFVAGIQTTFASTACATNSNAAGTSSDGVDYIACGGGDPMKVTMPWGTTGYDTAQMKSGVTVTDEGGVPSTCPEWFGQRGCFDLTKTEYYRSRMRALVADLTTKGFISAFPSLQGWVGK